MATCISLDSSSDFICFVSFLRHLDANRSRSNSSHGKHTRIYIILNWIELNQVRKWNWINMNSIIRQYFHYDPSFKTSLFIQFRKNDHFFGEFFVHKLEISYLIFFLFLFSLKKCSLSSKFFKILYSNEFSDRCALQYKQISYFDSINKWMHSNCDSKQFWVDVATFLLSHKTISFGFGFGVVFAC